MNEQQIEFINGLLEKARCINEKTEEHCNVHLTVDGFTCPIRVDDHQLLYIGAALLPNILNYLVNILPQFLYPYIVAYLQDLSDTDNPLTVNDLYQQINPVKDKEIDK